MAELASVSLLQKGEGEPLVFLHGYLSSKESFYYQIERFSRRFRVTAFDFWGMGKSAALPQPWSVGDYAAHTLALLRELGIDRARLIAHSFGGRVALKLLASEENPFSRALLTGCAGVPPHRGAAYRAKVAAYRAVRRVAPRFASRRFGSAEYRSLPPVMSESFKKIVNEDLTPLLPRIRVPVLYVFGKEDAVTPPYMAERLVTETPGAQLVWLPGTHFCFCEHPQAFNAVAEEFL